MANKCKYYKQKRQYKYVEESTWIDVVPAEYQKGELYEYESADCPGIDYSKEYLTFIPTTGSSTFTFNGVSANTVSYSLDSGTTWVSLASSAASPSVSAGQKIMWKGTCVPQTSDNYPLGIGKFAATDKFIVEGNAMSLLYDDDFIGRTNLTGKNSAFYELFSGNTNVVSAENLSLPAATLASDCYNRMFIFCTSLTTAPSILPATTLAEYCCNQMFYKCTSLTTAPELPATTLVPYCYYDMFGYCESLTTAPYLPATTLAERCYMLMFQYCTSLTTAPALPATTLVERCYNGMFQYCSSLNSITCLATDISASSCTSVWVYGVSPTGTFTKASSMSSWTTGDSGIPNGWTAQNY